MKVLVAGATGHLGRALLAELRDRGHSTRALVRGEIEPDAADEVVRGDAEHDDLDAACAGADVVISALGATSRFDRGPRRHFADTDTSPNLRLLGAAERAGVGRFAYVTILDGDRLRANPYADAHEQVVDALRGSALPHTIIRANGFFSAYDEVLELARKGRARLIGDPDARSNPIHDADLAVAVVDAVEAGEEERAVGGPETLTRLQEHELAYAAAGKPDKKVGRLPAPFVKVVAAALRPVDPRRAAILRFLLAIGERDMVGPPHGDRRLGAYLRQRAADPPDPA